MRMKHLLLATVAVLATVMPARADMFFQYRILDNPPTSGSAAIPADLQNFNALGDPGGNFDPSQYTSAQTSPLIVGVGQTKYLLVTFRKTNTAPIGTEEAFWAANNTTYRLKSFGMNMTFDPSFINNPYIPLGTPPNLNENLSNIATQTPYGVIYPNQPYPANYRQVAAATGAGGLAPNGSGTIGGTAGAPFFAFKIVGVAPTPDQINGTPITFSQYTTGPGGTSTPLWEISNDVAGQSHYLDSEVFGGAHPTFSFNVVVPTPEPSSMCLAGIAFAGLGWRKLRRKKA